LVNVDFADVSRVMRNSGRAHMAVATAEGEDRALQAAQASLESPLLDHNQIAGAKNILLNISVDKAENLIYQEVIEILNFIQAHASIKLEDGSVHTATIIWGTSEKPSLGDALELVVVATGFEEMPVTMPLPEPVVLPASAKQPAVELEPIKPIQPKQTQRPIETVVLGAPSNRYKNIESTLNSPSYVRRQAQLAQVVSQGSTPRKEVLQNETPQEKVQSQPGLFESNNQ
jgi:cell division protein FtsZ